VQVRWPGHRLTASLDVQVDPSVSVTVGHTIAAWARARTMTLALRVIAAAAESSTAGRPRRDTRVGPIVRRHAS